MRRSALRSLCVRLVSCLLLGAIFVFAYRRLTADVDKESGTNTSRRSSGSIAVGIVVAGGPSGIVSISGSGVINTGGSSSIDRGKRRVGGADAAATSSNVSTGTLEQETNTITLRRPQGRICGRTVFLVTSSGNPVSRQASLQRKTVRDTWGSQFRKRIVFYAPLGSGSAVPPQLADEAKRHDDLLVLAVPWHRYRLLSGLIQLRDQCQDAKAFILAHSNSLWNAAKLDEFLKSGDEFQPGALYGRKSAKGNALEREPGYILSDTAVDALRSAAANLSASVPAETLSGPDAAYLTGPLRETAGLELAELAGLHSLPMREATAANMVLNACFLRKQIAVSGLVTGHMVRLWRRFAFRGLHCPRGDKRRMERRRWRNSK